MQDRLKEIRERAEKATPAPWGCKNNYHINDSRGHVIMCGIECNSNRLNDIKFVINSPADTQFLLSALEEAQKRLIQLEIDINRNSGDNGYVVFSLQNDLKQSQDRERVLREALEFYADKRNYEERNTISEASAFPEYDDSAIFEDEGKIAREALG